MYSADTGAKHTANYKKNIQHYVMTVLWIRIRFDLAVLKPDRNRPKLTNNLFSCLYLRRYQYRMFFVLVPTVLHVYFPCKIQLFVTSSRTTNLVYLKLKIRKYVAVYLRKNKLRACSIVYLWRIIPGGSFGWLPAMFLKAFIGHYRYRIT